MSDIADKVLDWYAAKSMVEALRDAGGSDDLYRAHTFELKADDLFREITLETEALAKDKARLDGLERLATKVEVVEIVDNWNGHNGFTLFGMGAPEEPSTGLTLRDAIDDELRAEAQGVAIAQEIFGRSPAGRGDAKSVLTPESER